ncbi:MAG: ABC-type dipeptide/oligopeptide/nickel transport system, permease component [Oscillospiraceae bacterium]|nr:ABC-type dipeptide/oligopeptide/nickel transport system, permease component [Oscillospiraceae bacterium]
MLRYILKRLLMMIPVLVGVVVVVFTINYFTSISPAAVICGSMATDEQIAAKEQELGLDKPYLVQIGTYFFNIITKGTLGDSYIYKTPVLDMIASRLPNTIRIGLCASVLSAMIGIPLGILAAVKQNSSLDYASTFLAILTGAIPSFCLCLLLQLLFAMKLHWFPISGVKTWQSYILPIVSVALMPVAMTMRMTRSAMLEAIRQDYVRTARAKGLPEKTVIWNHTLKNALIPIITVIGMNIGISLTGSIIVETIFNIPGLGFLMNSSISQKDFITTQGCVLVAAFIMTFMTLLTDLVYAVVDPRIKSQYTKGKKAGKKSKLIKGGDAA